METGRHRVRLREAERSQATTLRQQRNEQAFVTALRKAVKIEP